MLQLTDLRGQAPPRVSRLLLDLLRLQVEFARGQRPAELPAMREAWTLDGLIGIYACGLSIEVAGRDGDPSAAVDLYDEGVAVLSASGTRASGPGSGWRPPRPELSPTTCPTPRTSSARRWSRRSIGSPPKATGCGTTTRTRPATGVRRVRPGSPGWTPSGCGSAGSPGSTRPPQPIWSRRWRHTVRAFEAIGYAYETARSRAVLVEVLRASGDSSEADRECELAVASATALQAAPLLGRLGGTDPAPPPERRRDIEPGGLTPRELEVLALMASGRSNSEIGQQLFISRKTASVHVSNILAKLGAVSRTEAVALARRRGLLQ